MAEFAQLPPEEKQLVDSKWKWGAWGEMTAAAWLFENGFDVFRNVAPAGPIDIVGVKDGVPYFFDVKVIKVTVRDDGSARVWASAGLNDRQQGLNVTLLYVTKEGVCGFTVGEIREKYDAIHGGRERA